MSNRDTAIAAANTVYKLVEGAQKTSNAELRWFWELVQNAKDTVAPLGQKLDIRLTLNFEDSHPSIIFEHNGANFRKAREKYQYDDPKCLLLANSGKEDSENKKEDNVTGKFGTGFQSTHVLTPVIKVNGILDSSTKLEKFELNLDRRYSNRSELAEKIEEALDSYDKSFNETTSINSEFATKFTYMLEYNAKGFEFAKELCLRGLKNVEEITPIVLALCPEIDSIELINAFDTRNIKYSRKFKNCEFSSIITHAETEKVIVKSDGTKALELSNYLVVNDNNSDTSILAPFAIDESGWRFMSPNENIPTLFCTFPLIGSNRWKFPVIIHSSSFMPKTERDGLLLDDYDSTNKPIIQASIKNLATLIEFANKKPITRISEISKIYYENCPEWVSQSWYDNLLANAEESIKNTTIIKNVNNNPILLKDAIFPYDADAENLESIWKLTVALKPDAVPFFNECDEWIQVIKIQNSKWKKNNLYTIRMLIKDVANANNLNRFSELYFQGEEAKSLSWLNELLNFILNTGKDESLIKENAIIPNKFGTFCCLNDQLWFDEAIPPYLVEMLEPISNWKIKSKLIHDNIKHVEYHLPKSIEYVSTKINELLTKIIEQNFLSPQKDLNEIYSTLFFQVAALSDGSDDKEDLFKFAVAILPNIKNHYVSAVELRAFDFVFIETWLVQEIITNISKKSINISDLRSSFSHFASHSENELLIWCHELYKFLARFRNGRYLELLNSNRIVLNQYLEFCKLTDLKLNIDITEELLDISNLPILKKDIRSNLIHRQIANVFESIQSVQGITFKEIAETIDEFIESYDGDKQRSEFAQLIFELNNSKSLNKGEQRKYFKFFNSKRDSLIVGTLGEGEDLANVATLIQNRSLLASFAAIASGTEISPEQLADIAKLVSNNSAEKIDAILKSATIGSHGESPSDPKKTLEELSKLIPFEGLDLDYSGDESIWKKVAMFFINTLSQVGIKSVDTYMEFLEKIETGRIIEVAGVRPITMELDSTFDTAKYKADIMKEAIAKVLSELKSQGYELLSVDNYYPNVLYVRHKGREFNVIIRPGHGMKYMLYPNERKILECEYFELWVSDGKFAFIETYGKLIQRVYDSGAVFIPLSPFIPGKNLSF